MSTTDELKVLYTSRSAGQRSLIPSLPVFPLAVAATMGPDEIIAYRQGGSTNPTYINRVVFRVFVGAGGALALDDNAYLSVSTGFGEAANNLQKLVISAVDTTKTTLAYMYEVVHLNAKSQKSIDLANCNQIILPKQLDDFQLKAKDSLYSVNWSRREIESVARGQNDLLALIGSGVSGVRTILGENHTVDLGFIGDTTVPGGTYYDALGITSFESVKITTEFDDRVYLLRAVDTSNV
ncbi:hypothetical protein [Dysgonomonas sp. GY617]|uniref:hypothetical protein n=1 Tax=Dysgonomonas sp. GY617 TaxID=2780420 RepID=UPI0018834935|nr:hypothetical protein [Dysgonomonas sp. GY617]MBF0574415.1 hypothetical protein [Dysgonomonas sp. GY617]